ncbi:MAG: glycosyltransferase family 2 protein [Candidatus Omnitrophota bacterium]
MKVSGFTITRNAVKFGYPVLESIQSILPICDEFIVNVGDSQDSTLELIRSLKDEKIKIVQNQWDLSKGKEVLSHQTNLALKECSGDWAFYLQSDEVIHEADLPFLRQCMEENLHNQDAEALRFAWLHFYGSYYRYRIDLGWYQKQDRIIKNNGEIISCEDAYTFKRKDGQPLKRINTRKFLYHYGWVQNPEIMKMRRENAQDIGFSDKEKSLQNSFDHLDRFPIYFGTHPAVMREKIEEHGLSQDDWVKISRKYWWHPFKVFRVRYKSPKRIKIRIK